jgi:hypothetical protein
VGRPAARTATGLTLDAGALIGVDRGSRELAVLLQRARQLGLPLYVPVGAVARSWRNGRLQVRLARLLASADVEVVALDDASARAAGQLCGATQTSDVVDASVVLCALDRGTAVITSDPEDLRRLDTRVELIAV